MYFGHAPSNASASSPRWWLHSLWTTVTCKTIITFLAHEAKSRSWWWCADFFSKDTVRLSVNLTALIPAAPCWDEGGDCVDEPESERESWDNKGGVLSISSCNDKNNPFCQVKLPYLNGSIMWLEPTASHIHEASKSKRSKQNNNACRRNWWEIIYKDKIIVKYVLPLFPRSSQKNRQYCKIFQFVRLSWKIVNFVNFVVLQGQREKLSIL